MTNRMDVAKQISYWQQGAEEEWVVAVELVERAHYRQGLFFAHLALEKALKAHVSRETQAVPPKIHNLVRLYELSNLLMIAEQYDVLADMNAYHLEGRYAEITFPAPTKEKAAALMNRVERVFQWLIQQLPQQ